MYQPKRILVTGSAGFIGSHFVHHLLQTDPSVQVVSLDKMTYAASPRYLEGLDATRHQLVEGDITDKTLVHTLLRIHEIDTIVHFAAESHVDRSIASPSAFIDTNVVGTFVLLEEARQFWQNTCHWDDAMCRFHHVSTDEVYGSLESTAPAFTEIHPYQPHSPYAASKAASDHLVRAYHHTYGLPVTMSNCSNNYGPHQHVEKLIPTVISACFKKQPIPLYGSGLNVRDWLYVGDHVQAIDCIVRQAAVGATYHIGGKTEKTNREVVESICDVLDVRLPWEKSYRSLMTFTTDRLGHDWRYAMNIEKIQRELGWVPQHSFHEGILNTIEYYMGAFL